MAVGDGEAGQVQVDFGISAVNWYDLTNLGTVNTVSGFQPNQSKFNCYVPAIKY